MSSSFVESPPAAHHTATTTTATATSPESMMARPAAPAWGKKKAASPWQKKPSKKQPQSQPMSLAAIQLEQEQHRQDEELARRLQEEEDERQRLLQQAAKAEAEGTAAAEQGNANDGGQAAADAVDDNDDDDDDDDGEDETPYDQLTPEEQLARDAALAAKLQQEEEAVTKTKASASTPAATTSAHQPQQSREEDTSEDYMVALALQQELNEEHEARLDELESRANPTPSKLTIRMSHHRAYPSNMIPETYAMTQEEEDAEWEDSKEEAFEYDRTVRSFRDRHGAIVTKHNKADNERRNRRKMEKHFPIGFNCGDLKGAKRLDDDVRLSNRVYNHLKRFADKGARQAARVHEKKEHSTAVMAMDKKTRVLVFKMINAGELNSVDGAVSTGKESVIFHGARTVRAEECEDYDADATLDADIPDHEVEVALKVFKTTLTEFTERQQFLHGDRRYARRVGKQHARKLVKLWAEKELANLTRMRQAGIPCPHVYQQRQHVLVMSFIGRNGRAAPKLKDIDWERKSERTLYRCYQQVCDNMKAMYTKCHLVHCDLSEYNILWFDRMPWIIDVGQSVETRHGRALAYLYRDCKNVSNFFTRVGCADAMSPEELFKYITGKSITAEQGGEAVQHIPILDKRGKLQVGQTGDTSDVVFRSDALSMAELRNALQDSSGSGSGSGSDDDDMDDDDDDEDGHAEGDQGDDDKDLQETVDPDTRNEEKQGIKLKFIDTSSKFGHGRFKTMAEKHGDSAQADDA